MNMTKFAAVYQVRRLLEDKLVYSVIINNTNDFWQQKG